jgi:PAS domain S-box-containing protein
MKIAIVGGGTRGRTLMELIEKHPSGRIQPTVVAVADQRPDAPAMVEARRKNVYVTTDYNDIFPMENIDLIVELTGDRDLFQDILSKKKKTVRAVDHETVFFFWGLPKPNYNPAESKAMYDIIINHLLQELMVIGTDYRILNINNSLLNRLGLERKDTIGKYCYEISHRELTPCSGKNHPCPLEDVIKTRQPVNATHVHLDLDNNEHFISMSCYPIFENGKVVGIAELCKDITEEINVHKAMQAQEKLASIGGLAAGVAHEINNPMTTILTSAMLIQEEIGADSPFADDLKTIVDETLRCRKIVTSLLNFARQTQPAKKLSAINELVKNCVVLVKKQAAFSNIIIKQKLAKELPPVLIDQDQIQQALINLLLNAIEATPDDGKINIMTELGESGRSAVIKIADTGKGIPPELLGRIFDPFFTSKENGTGLGLSITHGIIKQHGGTLAVKSVLGVGTIFTIDLPLSKEGSNAP